MLSRIAKACLAAAALSFLPAVAGAVIIVVDPRDYASGTDISHAYDGLAMRRLRQNDDTPAGYDPVASPITVSEFCSYGPSPCLSGYAEVTNWSQCVGAAQSSIQSRYCSLDPWSVLELTFDVPTNLVQISASWGSDSPGMYIYDSLGNRIALCFGGHGSTNSDCGYTTQPYQSYPDHYVDNVTTLTFDSTVANVSRVVFAGVAGSVTANTILYRYNVPEPGTLALLGLGLVGLVAGRRRPAARLAKMA